MINHPSQMTVATTLIDALNLYNNAGLVNSARTFCFYGYKKSNEASTCLTRP